MGELFQRPQVRFIFPENIAKNLLRQRRIPNACGNILCFTIAIPPRSLFAFNRSERTERLNKSLFFSGRPAKLLEPSQHEDDLLLLGLGPDGHTASLFPGQPSLDEATRNVIPAIGPKPPPQRITMTFPLINAARSIAFLVNEAAKAQVIREVQAGDPRYPASRIASATWLLGFAL